MTAPDRTTWTVAEDGWGDPTIWTDGDHAVATRCGDRIHIDPAFTEQVWEALTRVLAPDEATVEEISAEVGEHDLITSTQPWTCSCGGWSLVIGAGSHAMHFVRAHITALAALADTSAQGATRRCLVTVCCDMHNRNCEPPSELCCQDCTEIDHPMHWTTECIAPDLSGPFDVIAEPDLRRAEHMNRTLRRVEGGDEHG